MNLKGRLERLEKEAKHRRTDFILFCGHKMSTRGIIDDWVSAVLEVDQDES
ncbi:hypothetical protein [Halobacillus karajensis]|uniref:Uncharacterized protein n=1 Tax=Halobacillus karajensis TaxID=195088 RepID=A0A024P7N2_9BACI|nr:hypothetical protein [Halobacillus karajensis]CDQ20981.1 hypothetical protein BN982_03342 [Halobacillus karajensis]CDQ24955.1 hypothetical protein BN983_03256 [Halobacillus karajensis]CDQ28684.1 hypothetical protein BN981_02997 [Halobacillus karajensis]